MASKPHSYEAQQLQERTPPMSVPIQTLDNYLKYEVSRTPSNAPYHQYRQVLLLDTVPSTNLYAHELLTSADSLQNRRWGELSVIATTQQTHGKGRLNREWVAPEGSSLCASLMIRPHANPAHRIAPEQYHWFTVLLALAAIDTLNFWGIEAHLKWPNDVLIGDKKCCGILAQIAVESAENLSAIVGIGMNINLEPEDFPVPTATSVLAATQTPRSLDEGLEKLCENFAQRYEDFARVNGVPSALQRHGISLMDSVRTKMSTLGQRVAIELPDGQKIHGVAEDINEDGEIIITTDSGASQSYAVGDVIHLRRA
ncbi:biotin--[acetyl-CoA-carboxylase] ligase [Rothia sp. CCM 9418]|uniref:biotin--[acetyl-CoA-carboxylase] ligase n=1 Tax=Rothia sp. CCM 9418 TaxID=3402661 RepID=UPI003ADD5B11